MVVIVVNGIFIFPTFTNCVQTMHKGLRNNTLEGVIYLSAFVFGILGIVLLLVIQTGWNEWSTLQSLKISLCLACLSIAWCPFALAPGEYLTCRRCKRKRTSSDAAYIVPDDDTDVTDDDTNPILAGSQYFNDNPDESLDDDKNDFSNMNPHLKLRLVTSMIQIVLLPAFFFIIATQYKLIPISSLYEGFLI